MRTGLTRNSTTLGYVAMVGIAMCFASGLMLARGFPDVIPPFGMTAIRWLGIAALLLPFQIDMLRRYRAEIRATWHRHLVFGATGMAIPGLTTYLAAHTTPATNISLISCAAPMLVVLWGGLFYGERLGAGRLIGVALAVIGVMVIVVRGSLEVLLGMAFTPGDLWAAVGAAGWATYTVLLIPWRWTLPPRVQLGLVSLWGGAVAVPFAVWEAVTTNYFAAVDWRLPAIVAYTILVPSMAAFALHAYCARVLSPAHAAMSQYMVPVFAAALGALVLAEPIHGYTVAGAAAVLLGVWLASRRVAG
jgi:drug/metabolite transporter (DMT)-like permease